MKNIKKTAVLVLSLLVILTCFTACGKKPDELIIGSWKSQNTGIRYEFKEEGICVINFLDVSFTALGYNFTGDVEGQYSMTEVEKDVWHLEVEYTLPVLTALKVSKEFKVDITEGAMTLTDIEGGEQEIFVPYSAAEPETSSTTNQ